MTIEILVYSRVFVCSFGSKVMSPRTGILFNNQMDDFTTGATNDFGIPDSDSNWVTAGRRPLSSMCPTIFTDTNGMYSI